MKPKSLSKLSTDIPSLNKLELFDPQLITESFDLYKKYGVETNLLLPEIIEYNKTPERIQHIWDTKKKNKTTKT